MPTHLFRITAICLLLAAGSAKASFDNFVQPDTLDRTYNFKLNATDESVDVMDSIFESYFSTNPAWKFSEADYNRLGFATADTPKYTPEVYIERISKINSPIPYTYNKSVQAYIDLYTIRRRGQVSNMLGLSQVYFPLFEEELDKQNMPLELKYLPIIESALNTHAVSRAGATGLWQFMYGTGKLMGLQIDTYIDERRDPKMATVAAVRYLQDLYDIYDDWLLAIAAYNCGPGNVNKALRRAGGGEKTFWEIEDYLPRETRGYVPAFIAATYVFTYHKDHNIRPVKYGYDFNLMDTLLITRKITLEQLAPYVGLSVEELTFHNPALKTKTIPGSSYPYPVRLPMTAAALYNANADSLYASLDRKESEKLQEFVKTIPTSLPANASATNIASESNEPVYVSYTVKKGDNLGYISDWFDCTITEIKKWNGLKSTKLVPGQKLKMYVPESQKYEYTQINKMTLSQKQKLSSIELISSAPAEKDTSTPEYIFYTVKPGDTLWSIAKKYPDNTIEELCELNGLAKNETLRAGVKLRVAKSL